MDLKEGDDSECDESSINLKSVVNNGRSPLCKILKNGQTLEFKTWAKDLCEAMLPLAKILDTLHATPTYQASLAEQLAKIENPELTPSAKVLAEMKRAKITFAEFTRRQSALWQTTFLDSRLPEKKRLVFEELAADSIVQQHTIEAADTLDFDEYLQTFYQQYTRKKL